MSLRDELETIPTGRVYANLTNDWLETKGPAWEAEFLDLAGDLNISNPKLYRLARAHGYQGKMMTLYTWRREIVEA